MDKSDSQKSWCCRVKDLTKEEFKRLFTRQGEEQKELDYTDDKVKVIGEVGMVTDFNLALNSVLVLFSEHVVRNSVWLPRSAVEPFSDCPTISEEVECKLMRYELFENLVELDDEAHEDA